MNVILLPTYQATGAAIATLVACVTASILTVLLSFRYIVIKVNIKTIIYYLVLASTMFLCINWIDMQREWINLLAKVALGTAIIVTGVLVRENEIRAYAKNIFVGLRS